MPYADGVKPHPKIRKTVKWGGAVVTVLLVVVWIGSAWRGGGWMSRHGAGLAVMPGTFVLSLQSFPYENEFAGWGLRHAPEPMRWWFMGGRGNFGWNFWIPIWLPVLLSALATGAAWRLDALASRRARAGFCPKCNYDRIGLVPQAVCPECGTAAPPAAAQF